MNERSANFVNAIKLTILNYLHRVSQSKKVLLTIRLAACSFQRFLEVGDAIALQTGTYEFNENLA